jgi:HlyD family secretion protein
MKKIIALVVVLVLVAGGAYAYWQFEKGPQSYFRFDEVSRGRLVATVSSTGTLQPREVVDVGAQVAGPIIFLGKDPYTQSGIVDWGSEVEGPVLDKDGNVIKKGTVLAQIDDSLYKAAVNSAEAAVKSAQADYLLKSAQLEQATKDWKRAQSLYPTGGIAQAEYDQLQANYKVAQANIGVSQANIGTAQASLRTAQTNLNYSTICSPVKGVVIDRRVNVGQTVVASLSAPSLFLIAKDLTKMEVWATVNEVDVGRIKQGQDVKFTVDAFAGRVFKGKVVPQGRRATRLNATMNQNVVTYTVVVSADNEDETLYPYLTANLSFIVADKKDALRVPNAALRWQPSPQQIAPDQRASYLKLKGKKRSPTDAEGQDHGFVWVPAEGGYVRYIEVQTGVSDTVHTEVVKVLDGGNLPEHTQLIVGEGKTDARGGGDTSNPFSVKLFNKNAAKPKE